MTFGMVVLVVLTTSVPTAQAEVCNEKPCITVAPCLTAGFSNQLNLLSQSKEKIKYKEKYVTSTYVNIREQPSKNSEVIKQVSFNEKLLSLKINLRMMFGILSILITKLVISIKTMYLINQSIT